jgi:hypothetical protein
MLGILVMRYYAGAWERGTLRTLANSAVNSLYFLEIPRQLCKHVQVCTKLFAGNS